MASTSTDLGSATARNSRFVPDLLNEEVEHRSSLEHTSRDTAQSPQQANNTQALTQLLGWFSVGLGVTQLLAPRALSRTIGISERHTTLMRCCGAREIVSGVGLLTQGSSPWAWTRVAGDAIDIALLKAAAREPDADPQRIAIVAAALAGISALDVYAGRALPSAAGAPTEIEVSETITIHSTPQQLYAFWRNLENLPRFMLQLKSVETTGATSSRWSAAGPAGTAVTWESEITADEPDTRISWATLPDSPVDHAGTVHFESAPGGRGTVVRVNMIYKAPAGRLGVGVAKILGREPGQQIRDDLRHFKQLIETGEIATTHGQPTGKRSLLGQATLGGRIQ